MSTRHSLVTCLIVFASGSSARGAIHYDLSSTDDADAPITAEIIVDASPEEVFDLWTSAEGVKQFWVADAIIESSVGGRYELMFDVPEDAAGPYDFMYQTKILAVECGLSLSFEFRKFRWDRDQRVRHDDMRLLLSGDVAGTGITEYEEFRGSWVALRFDSVDGESGKTRVRIQHHGLRSDAGGAAARRYMQFHWLGVLRRLNDCRAERSM